MQISLKSTDELFPAPAGLHQEKPYKHGFFGQMYSRVQSLIAHLRFFETLLLQSTDKLIGLAVPKLSV